jgi:hypothetical protein
MWCNKEYSKRIVGNIDGVEKLLNQCSDIYKLIPNSDIFPKINEILDMFQIEYRVVYRHINHVRFYADYIITDKRYAYRMNGTNDVVNPKLTVQHSYNGLTKYKITFGYFRVVCTNGLTIAVAEMKEFNLAIGGKHTENIVRSFEMLTDMLENFVTNASKITKRIVLKYEVLGGTWVENLEDRLTEVLEANNIAIKENSKFNTLNNIMARITHEANLPNLGYNGRVNDWLIYNGINQYLNDNDMNIMTPDVRMEKDSKVLEYMLETA